MSESSLTAISPLDGRYAEKLRPLQEQVSEFGLIRYRVLVEVEWLLHLYREPGINELDSLDPESLTHWEHLRDDFDQRAATRIKSLEATTNHDVKAVEYYLRENCAGYPALEAAGEFIHFACTSEDINNLAYGLMLTRCRNDLLLPELGSVLDKLIDQAEEYADLAMLSRTHGQPATPTTLGKEFANVAWRLAQQIEGLQKIALLGKFNGAVGNFNAHLVAYPELDWTSIARRFVEGLGLTWNPYTTQIEPHDYVAEIAHNLIRINTLLLDLCRDLWSYISIGYFKQKLKSGEVGSSTMPHKVNPIDFENAEGNFGLANALLEHLAIKLPQSRWQRDLTDSTVMRNLGSALGYSLLSLASLQKGLAKLEINEPVLAKDLDENWEVLGEAIQTVMRRYAIPEPYEKLKSLTRGQRVNQARLHEFIQALDIPAPDKNRLKALTPDSYIGNASAMAKEVRSRINRLLSQQ